MASDTDNEDDPEDSEQTTPQHHRYQQKEDVIFDTAYGSDGSVYIYEFTNGNTAAGYAARSNGI